MPTLHCLHSSLSSSLRASSLSHLYTQFCRHVSASLRIPPCWSALLHTHVFHLGPRRPVAGLHCSLLAAGSGFSHGPQPRADPLADPPLGRDGVAHAPPCGALISRASKCLHAGTKVLCNDLPRFSHLRKNFAGIYLLWRDSHD